MAFQFDPMENERPEESAATVPAAVYEAARSLLRVTMASEAVAILTRLVRELGGEAPLDNARVGASNFVDCRLRDGQSFRATAPEGTPALLNIQKYLPPLVEDARYVLHLKGREEQLARQAAIDPVSGLPDHNSMSRLLSRLSEGDIIIAIELVDPMRIEISPGAELSDELVRAFARVLRQTVRGTDHLARQAMGRGFLVVMPHGGPKAAHRLLDRLHSAWVRVRPSEANFVAGIAAMSAGGWRPAILAAESALQRAMQSEADTWATASESDFEAIDEGLEHSDVVEALAPADTTSEPELRVANLPQQWN